jgi:hypothetical protein
MAARFVNNSGKDARNAFHINRCDSFNSDNLQRLLVVTILKSLTDACHG